jgi:pyruvate,water dikinase
VLTFDRLLTETSLGADLREMLRMLQEAYRYPVDIEFTANYLEARRRAKSTCCNAGRCRCKGAEINRLPELQIPDEDRTYHGGPRCGHRTKPHSGNPPHHRTWTPQRYSNLPTPARHDIAHLIGEINRLTPPDGSKNVMVLGPGRWGTRSPELGIPGHLR